MLLGRITNNERKIKTGSTKSIHIRVMSLKINNNRKSSNENEYKWAISRSASKKTWIAILGLIDSLPLVHLLSNEFLCKFSEMVEIQFVAAIALAEDSSVLTMNYS